MREATRIVRATLAEARPEEALHAGPVFASKFHLRGNAEGTGYTYGRSGNPTWTELEAAIGVLEGREGGAAVGVRVFGSGVAAVAAVFGAVLRAGDTVVLQEGIYFGVRKLLEEFGAWGVKVRRVAAGHLGTAEAVAGARLVWVETPSNPAMEVVDIFEVAEAAHAVGAVLAVDNSTATPLGQRPLDLGADLSVCSDSKVMGGHGDLVMGHVATRDEKLLAGVDRERTMRGGIAGPMEAWLLLRSLPELPLRLERMSTNAGMMAKFLEGQEGVADVRYPGLKGHPGYEVAAEQMRYFGPVLGFTLRDRAVAERFLAECELVTEATSFGGVATTAERRARWGGDAVAEGFIRMSLGVEDIEDLMKDVWGALEACRG